MEFSLILLMRGNRHVDRKGKGGIMETTSRIVDLLYEFHGDIDFACYWMIRDSPFKRIYFGKMDGIIEMERELLVLLGITLSEHNEPYNSI